MSGFYRPKWERKWARVPRPLPVLYFERAIIARPGIFPTFRQHFIARRQTPLKILSLLISGEKPNFSYKHAQIIQMYGYSNAYQSEWIFDPLGGGHKGCQQRSSNHHPQLSTDRFLSNPISVGFERRMCVCIYTCVCVYMCMFRSSSKRFPRKPTWTVGGGWRRVGEGWKGGRKSSGTERNNKRLNWTATSGCSSTSCPRGNSKQWLNATSKIRYSMRRAVRLIGA